MAEAHIADQVAAELERQGWQSDGNIFSKRIDGFAEPGTVSDGTRVVTLSICPQGRWLDRNDGWGNCEREIDLRDYAGNPVGAIAAVLSTEG